MVKKAIETKKAVTAIGPYSQAVKMGNFIFCSGNVGIDPRTNNFMGEDIKAQTKQTLENIKNILKAADAGVDDVVKVTVYLKDMDDFSAMNEEYASFFQKPYPARATIEVARLPKDAKVEIECVAYVKNDENDERGCNGECSCCGET